MAVDVVSPGSKGVRLKWAFWPLTDRVVLSRTTALPGSPVDGEVYIVPSGAGSHPNEIAMRFEGTWIYLVPSEGWGAYVLDDAERVQFDGTHWTALAGTGGVGDVVGPAGSTDGEIALFDGVDGKKIKSSGVAISTDGTLASNSDAKVATEKAVKTYIDSLVVNLGNGGKVRAATTANITISTALNNGDTLDGVALVTGDLVLVKNQATAAQNGVYVVGVTPVRAGAFDTFNEHPGSVIVVEEGTTNADTLWLCTTNTGGTLNTDPINYQQLVLTGTVPSSRTLTAGTGLTGLGDLSADRTVAVDKASVANIQSAAANKVVTSDNLIGAAAPQTLAAGATISWDMHSGFNAKVTLGSAANAFQTPTNPHIGMTYVLEVIQDATGSRTATWASAFDWGSAGAPTLSTGASKHDFVTLYCYDDTTPKFRAAFNKAA